MRLFSVEVDLSFPLWRINERSGEPREDASINVRHSGAETA
jgi:hypothetical protein